MKKLFVLLSIFLITAGAFALPQQVPDQAQNQMKVKEHSPDDLPNQVPEQVRQQIQEHKHKMMNKSMVPEQATKNWVAITEQGCLTRGTLKETVHGKEIRLIELSPQEIGEVMSKECVNNIADQHAEEGLKHAVLKYRNSERNQWMKEHNMEEHNRDVGEESSEQEAQEVTGETGTKAYTNFVDISVAPSSASDAYSKSMDWVWISDQELWGSAEHWMKTSEFFDSDELDQNPTNRLASDCSEQANTLASMIRASGVPKENVRVVLGEVKFGDKVGGHAWVEVKKDGDWVQLDPSSGDYWNGQEVIDRSLSFDYFETHEYPVQEVWVMYNDEYYKDFRTGDGNVGWTTDEKVSVGNLFEEEQGISWSSPYVIGGIAGLIVLFLFLRGD